MSWLCACGLVNSGLNEDCPGKLNEHIVGDKHHQISPNKLDWHQISVGIRELRREQQQMTPEEELFSKFYNHEKILVKDMDIIQLREHREELSKIAFEAKARLRASDDETRDRTAKTKTKEWLTSIEGDQSTSDVINVVEARKKRMSKMDKLRKDLLAGGIDEATVNEMIKNLEKKATDSNLKTVTFNKPSVEISAVQVEVKKEEPKEPFNPLSIKFG